MSAHFASLYITRVQQAAARSPWLRAAMIAALGISVTIGGVLAGAMVVAPVVAKASRPESAAQLSRLINSATAFAVEATERTRAISSSALANAPEPVARFALPGLALASILTALTALLVRRRSGGRGVSLIPATASAPRTTAPRATTRPTARSSARDSRTPKAVEALAASGASTSDIAWRTGLPIDAVTLLLAISSGARQLQPPTA
jgi:hypothetical protein